MSRYHMAEAVYAAQDILLAKILSQAVSALQRLGTDRTPMEEEAMILALRLEDQLRKEPK